MLNSYKHKMFNILGWFKYTNSLGFCLVSKTKELYVFISIIIKKKLFQLLIYCIKSKIEK